MSSSARSSAVDPATLSPVVFEAAAAGAMFAGFLRSESRFGDRPALEVGGETFTYAQLGSRARRLAATLAAATPAGGSRLVAVFASRSVTAFAGILGALLAGRGYVALNRRFPPERTRLMLERCDTRALIVDRDSAAQLDAVLPGLAPMLLVFPEHDDVSEFSARFPAHTAVSAAELAPAEAWQANPVNAEDTAYLIFTSGSTGTPKAVMVPHRAVRRYIDVGTEQWQLTEQDRCSQMYEMTFDASVSDMFIAWESGACVCCPSQQELVIPQRFIIDHELTIFDAVPSTGLLMKRLGMLKPGSYPSLRLVLVGGEAFPAELASAWAAAAPNAVVENSYGPTEATVACAAYRWDPERSPAECELGVVPIGWFNSGTTWLVLDADGSEVAPGEDGALFLAGEQVATGYWRDPEGTRAAFSILPGRNEVHYRTGDRVRRPVGNGPMTYLGRVDLQIKVSGHRVELGEIEAVLREELGMDEVVAVGWPKTDTGYAGIAAFVRAVEVDADSIRSRIVTRLPPYMVPREIHAVSELPLNDNGKIDRRALLERLGEPSA